MNETSLVTRQMLVSFITQAVEFGMKPTILKLFNLNIEAQGGEQIIFSLLQHNVYSIEELDLNKNPMWWSQNNAEILSDIIKRQEKL